MTKRKVTKLFAVVALATSTQAVAGPGHEHVAPARTPATTMVAHRAPEADQWATPDRATPPPVPQVGPITAQVLAVFGISAPRRLSNGAPACGNVASRAPRRADCVRTKP